MKTKQLIYSAFFLLNVLISAPAVSASYEDGQEAYLAKDYDKALSILTPMAHKGHAKAQVTLGVMYDFGHGVKQDPVEAIHWYELAAEQGNSVVQHDLGVKYFKGAGIPQDYEKAANWWHKAAENGVAESQYNLGILYTRGLGYEKNTSEAVKWYSKAASQGHAHAQYSLGVMHSFGQGVAQNYSKAASYFTDAAEQNIAQAQYNLAVLLEHGRGTDIDIPRAKKWYRRAAENNIEQASERLALLEELDEGDENKVAAKSKSSKNTKDEAPTDTQAEPQISQATNNNITIANVEVEVEEIKAEEVTLPTEPSIEQPAKPKLEPAPLPEHKQAQIPEEVTDLAGVDTLLKDEDKSATQEEIPGEVLTNKETKPADVTTATDEIIAMETSPAIESIEDKLAEPAQLAQPTITTHQAITVPDADEALAAEEASQASKAERDLDSLKERQAAYVALPESMSSPVTAPETMIPEETSSLANDTSIDNTPSVSYLENNANDWIRSQNPERYALQMIAFREINNATRFLENLDLEGEKGIYKSIMHGKTIYKVIYGNFESHRASLKARRELPAKYRTMKPFPRNFEFLQNDIKE